MATAYSYDIDISSNTNNAVFDNKCLCGDSIGFVYDRETHSFTRLKTKNASGELIDFSSSFTSLKQSQFRKYNDNIFISFAGGYFYKFVFDGDVILSVTKGGSLHTLFNDGGASSAGFTTSGTNTAGNVLSDDCSEVICKATKDNEVYMLVGNFNVQNLTITYSRAIDTNTATSVSLDDKFFYLSDHKFCAYNNSGASKAIYDSITGEVIATNPLNERFTISPYAPCPTIQRFVDSRTNTTLSPIIYGFPDNDTVEYIINSCGTTTQAGKYYGIASEALGMGEVGTAQLLFTT